MCVFVENVQIPYKKGAVRGFWGQKRGYEKWVSYLYRTATTTYPCLLPHLGDSVGAGRIRLTRHKIRKNFYLCKKNREMMKNDPVGVCRRDSHGCHPGGFLPRAIQWERRSGTLRTLCVEPQQLRRADRFAGPPHPAPGRFPDLRPPARSGKHLRAGC